MTLADLRRFRLVYLATPYTNYLRGTHVAFMDAAKLAGALIKAGVPVYSPIVHSHPISCHGGIDPFDHELWMDVDQTMISLADALAVGRLEGWEHLGGIAEELLRFTCAGKPIFHVDPFMLTVTAEER